MPRERGTRRAARRSTRRSAAWPRPRRPSVRPTAQPSAASTRTQQSWLRLVVAPRRPLASQMTCWGCRVRWSATMALACCPHPMQPAGGGASSRAPTTLRSSWLGWLGWAAAPTHWSVSTTQIQSHRVAVPYHTVCVASAPCMAVGLRASLLCLPPSLAETAASSVRPERVSSHACRAPCRTRSP